MVDCFSSRRSFLRLAAIGVGAALLPSWTLPKLLLAAGSQESPASQVLPYRVGQWLPSDQTFLAQWMRNHIEKVESTPQHIHPVIDQFRELIESDPEVFMLFNLMFDELPNRMKFNKDPADNPQIRDYKHMLVLMNAILTTAPEFNKTDLVGFPINAILDWPMGTNSGFAAFLNSKVNAQIKKILNEWGRFLSSPESCSVLTDHPRMGWFGADAKKAMPDFETDFICDPGKPHHGFISWDDFFTRRFREGRRPVAAPNESRVVVNACESAPYKIAHDVRRMERFWIKSQPYSLMHMLQNDEYTDHFVGGTIYQAFLSALSYHRWHSPVSGVVVKTKIIDGTYYSEALSMGFDSAGPNESQSYITDVATRALIFIQADDPVIGLMCFMAVGMAEVSTCEVTVSTGQRINKGDEIGMFHFGGSTHCLIFRPQVKLEFDLQNQKPGLMATNLKVNSLLAVAKG